MAARKPNPNTESVDNYLKAILALGGPEEQRVTSTALSDRLGVAPGFCYEHAAEIGNFAHAAGRV